MQENTKDVDTKDVKVIRTEAMAPAPQKTVAIDDQTEAGLRLFEERIRVAKAQLKAALQLTTPSQWMVYGEGDKQSIYATAGASDRILRMAFGMRWANKSVKLEPLAGGKGMTAIARGDLIKPDGEAYETFEGSRTMYYDAQASGGVKGYIKDEPNLIKSALANMMHIALTQILGLRFLSPKDFAEMGLDLSKLERRVEFQEHGNDESGGPVIPFGKNKGKPVSSLDIGGLNWFIDAIGKSIVDPEKSKWKGANEKLLTAFRAELAKRTAPQKDKAGADHAAAAAEKARQEMGGEDHVEDEPGADG